MQEQVDEKTIAISVKATKITGRLLAKALMAALKKMQEPSHKTGKQSIRSLSKHGTSLTNVEITGDNIGSFGKIARKYNLDYCLKKDDLQMPLKWYVFIKSKDSESLHTAIKEYSRLQMKYQNRKPSIAAMLKKAIEKVAQTAPPVRNRNRGGHEL